MKETCMLFGFGVGLITGALLYKYNQCAKKVVDKGEKAVMEEMENMEAKAEKVIKQAETKMKKAAEKNKNT